MTKTALGTYSIGLSRQGVWGAVQGGALEQMQGLVQQAVAPDWHPLPQAVQRAAACQEGVHALVFDVLMDKVSLCTHTARSGTTQDVSWTWVS